MSYGSPAICEWSKVNLPSADLWTTHVCQAPSTVTRELRSEAAGSELVERLIAAAGGIAGLVPSGTEPIPVKRSWNSEHGLQAERSICRRKPLDRAPADRMSLCANATSEAQPAFGLSDPSSANPSSVRLNIAGSIPVPVITHPRERPLPLISQACRHACMPWPK